MRFPQHCLFHVYFDYRVWPMSHLIIWRGGVTDLSCSLPPAADQDVSGLTYQEMSCGPSFYCQWL